jgi:hypothetical protein
MYSGSGNLLFNVVGDPGSVGPAAEVEEDPGWFAELLQALKINAVTNIRRRAPI